MKPLIIRVAVNTPAKQGFFDYSVPPELADRIRPGQMVIIPFSGTVHQGIVWQCGITPEVHKLSDIISIVDDAPVLTEAQMELAERIASRCLAGLPECINLLLTDKIRCISTTVYRWCSGAEVTIQNSLFDPGTSLPDRMTAFFHEHDDTCSEQEIAAAFRGEAWKPLIGSWMKQQIIRKERTFAFPKSRIKTVRTAFLCPGANEFTGKLGITGKTVSRREKALALLKNAENGIPTAEIERLASLKSEDLRILARFGLIEIKETETVRRHTNYLEELPASPIELTEEQQYAVDVITQGKDNPKRKPILLHGVTGSGKTEVYMRAAAEAIRNGKQVLMLVPEIALTPQLLSRFEKRFPGITGVYHSGLSEGERYDTWRCGRSGEYRVIIGPRSALAVPLPDLGLIMLDECHDDSYYQTNERPFFSTVRAAADLAELTHSQLVYGSATPTAAQMFKAEKSAWPVVKLKNRATGVQPPRVLLVDMREELKNGNSEMFSRPLMKEMQRSLDAGKQTLLFLNRRGTSAYTFCHSCGETICCPNCDVPFTWHRSRNRLECHFCGNTMPLPELCPNCGSHELNRFGDGVERIEELLQEKFPEARILRVDADTTAEKGSHEEILGRFARGEADIMVGTQMIAKGLDFPYLRLVGILLADVGSNFHDYRVDEHSYQMLTQVIGRAGRSSEQGLAILQTFQPERYSIRAAVNGSYEGFYRDEIAYRRMMGYPPFTRMVRLEVRDGSEENCGARITVLAEAVRKNIRALKLRSIRLIGPTPCYFPHLQGKYRFHLILRGPDPVKVLDGIDLQGVRVEVDPASLL